HSVAVAEWEGFVLLNLALNPEPFATTFAPIIDRFQRWGLPELQVAHTVEYDVQANWKLIFQNYNECYHCPTVHPALNQLTPYRNSNNDLEAGAFLGGPMAMSQPNGSMTMSGQVCAAPLAHLRAADLNLVYYYTIFPSFFLSLHPDYVLVHRLERINPARTRIVCEWLFHPNAIAQPGFSALDAVDFWDLTNRQDWQMCELAQQGVSSRAYTPGPYAELENVPAAFDREYLRVMG
ncbi:MAG: aromatic ring-hydroxylating dioxygenase subunit alpha, partial [Chloroflexota bacterium]|nr:aromatic ring-hydroxylating dioxygenase subunit alpha [Chloroflexota bacterium]